MFSLERHPPAITSSRADEPRARSQVHHKVSPRLPWRLFQVPMAVRERCLDRKAISVNDATVRTIIDLPEEQVKALDSYRKKERISRAEAVRRAVAAFLPAKPRKRFDFRGHPAFGSSKRFRKEDSGELVRRLRDEWE